jgi:hypothetical protein
MAPTTLNIDVKNSISSDQVYAYVTGLALENGNHVCLNKSDGKTPYFPESPAHTCAPLSENCSIPLGPKGSTTTITIPSLAGGRIWFSVGKELTFLVNPGPAIVEPSVTNPSDPNIHTEWAFCEFTFANSQLYANISYVDFVSLPVSLTMTPENGEAQKVLGLRPDGLASICAGLEKQSLSDSHDWEKLIFESGGKKIRVLSPNNGIVMNGGNLFQGYYDSYVNEVWEKYSGCNLTVDTQAQWGKLSAKVCNGSLEFSGIGSFGKPSTADVFGCSSGPFASNEGALGPLTARICAGLNRSTLLSNDFHPNNEKVSEYYKHKITNHYARLVHEANIDGRGYAFPYDDVPAPGGVDQSGFVNGSPKSFAVTIG